MPRYFVELSIPNTKQTMGFYLNGDTPEAITPMTPFIQALRAECKGRTTPLAAGGDGETRHNHLCCDGRRSGDPDKADYFLDYDVEIVSVDQTD
jgi:hypothetical protein